jgi:hypothetical protein
MATVAGVISMGAPLFCARLCSAWKRPVTKRGPQRRRQAGWLPVTRLQAETEAQLRYSAPAEASSGSMSHWWPPSVVETSSFFSPW